MDQQRGLEQSGLAISNRTPISTILPLCDVWLILSALQLTVTHPLMHEPLKQAMERIGRELEARIVEVLPDVAELAAAGWDRSQDYIEPDYEFDDDAIVYSDDVDDLDDDDAEPDELLPPGNFDPDSIPF